MLPIGFRFEKETPKPVKKDRNRRDSVKVLNVTNGVLCYGVFTTDLHTGKSKQTITGYVGLKQAREKLRSIIRALQ